MIKHLVDAAGRRAGVVLLLEVCAVFAASCALAAYLTWPVTAHLGDRIFGYPGDATGTIAFLWSLANGEGYNLLGATDVERTGAPFGWERPNGLNVQWLVVFFPAYLATLAAGPIVAYNLVVVSGLVFSGIAMYALTRRLGTSRLAAAWAGMVYTVFPWHLEKAQGHAGFVHLEGFPLLLLAVLAWYRRPGAARAVLVGAAVAFLSLTAGYFGIIGLVGVCALLAVGVWFLRRRGDLHPIRQGLFAFGASAGAAGLVYAFTKLGTVGGQISKAQDVVELQIYGARLWEFVVPSYRHPYLGDDVGPWLVERLHGSNFSETSLYVGLLTLLLAVGWVAWTSRAHKLVSDERLFITAAFSALAITAFVFSLPSPITEDVPGPSRLLWEVAPQFRVPTRFVALLMTALVPLAALGLDGLSRWFRAYVWSRARRVAPAGFIGAAMLASYLELSFVPPRLITDVATTPPEYSAVATAPPGSLAEYPLVAIEDALNSDYLLWQRAHRRDLLNGAPGGTLADAVRQPLIQPEAPNVAGALATLGVSVIVVRPDRFGPPLLRPPPSELGAGYRLIRRFKYGPSVWRVTANPAPVTTYTKGFHVTESPPGSGTVWRWTSQAHGSVDVYARRSGTFAVSFGAGSYGRDRVLRIRGRRGVRTARVSTQTKSVSFTVRLARGWSRLVFSTDPRPEPIPDGRHVGVYVSNWEFRPMRGRAAIESFPLRVHPLAP